MHKVLSLLLALFFIGPAIADECVTKENQRQLSLKQESDGFFRVVGWVNGRSVLFLIDTGSDDVGLTHLDAKKLGVTYDTDKGILNESANGDVLAFPVTLPSIQLGCIKLASVRASVVSKMPGDSILGMSFLSRIEWQYKAGILTLTQKELSE